MAKNSRLTIALIESTNAGSTDVWLSDDDGSRNAGRLALRVNANGGKRFYFRYFTEGKRTLVPLGPYAKTPTPNCLTLQEARDVALGYVHAIRTAGSPDLRTALLARITAAPPIPSVPASAALVSPQAKPPTAGVGKGSVLELCNAYVDHLRRRGAQSATMSALIVKNHVKPTEWAELPAKELTPGQAADMIRALVNKQQVTTAKHLRQLLHAAYNVAKDGKNNPMIPASFNDFGIVTNPVADTARMSGVIQARRRPAATLLELGHIWLDLNDSRYDLSVVVRAIRLNFYLGGQRCLQLLRCKVVNANLEKGVLLLLDGKGRRSSPRNHLLPLTDGARAEVLALRQMARDLGNSYLIPGAVKEQPLTPGPVSQFMTRLSRKLCASKKLSEPFCYANIRSTVETLLGEADVPPHVRAEIQSHDMGGVQKRHYDQAKYLKQKLSALETWEQILKDAAELAAKTSTKQISDARPVEANPSQTRLT